MSEAQHQALEEELRRRVDHAVARYEGKVPPFMMAKLRELAERYWREHPQASRILHRLAQEKRTISGLEVTGEAAALLDGRGQASGTGKE
jgi:hypothetical protein